MIQLAKKGFKIEDIHDTFKLIVSSSGNFRYINNHMYTVVQRIEEKDWIKGTKTFLEDIEVSCTHQIPKISNAVYEQSLSFLKSINNNSHSEAAILLVLKKNIPLENQEYRLIIPKQKVSSASVEYSKGMQEAYSELKEDEFFVGTIHSHPGFAASQSGTDKNDEDGFDGLHLTFGFLDRENNIDIDERLVFSGTTYRHKEVSCCPNYQIDNLVDFPKEWIDKVEANPYSSYTRSTVRPIKTLMKMFSIFSPKSKKGKYEPIFEKQEKL